MKTNSRQNWIKLFFYQHKKLIPIFINFLILIITCWFFFTSNPGVKEFLSRLDYIIYDTRMRLFLNPVHLKNLPVTIVDIDDKSLSKIGRWPWKRHFLAKLLQILKENGAAVVTFDIVFAEPEINVAKEIANKFDEKGIIKDKSNENIQKMIDEYDNDKIFANALKSVDTVLGYIFTNSEEENSGAVGMPLKLSIKEPIEKLNLIHMKNYIGNIPIIQNAATTSGFVTTIPDGDGVLRRTPLLLEYNGNVYPSLALRAAMQLYLLNTLELYIKRYDHSPILEGIYFGKYRIPTSENAEILIPYMGFKKSIPHVSAVDILNNNFDPKQIKNKLIFIGSSAFGVGDYMATPIQPVFPGVEIQATIAWGILTKHIYYIPAWARGLNLIIILVVGILLSLFLPYMRTFYFTFIVISMLIFLIGFNFIAWAFWSMALPIILPFAMIVVLALFNYAYGYSTQYQQKRQIENIFGQYVSPLHIKEMLAYPEGEYAFKGESRIITVLFADIRDFTKIAERLRVRALKNLLNEYLTVLTDVLFKNDGTIDKYVGDMVVAFWNAPLLDKKHEFRAISSAIKMQEVTKEFNKKHSETYPEIRLGIGVNTGRMHVGDMGSKFRRNYTVIGDAVNLGSRIQALTKYYHVDVIVTENTMMSAKDSFIYRYLDKILVLGKTESVKIFQPLAFSKKAAESIKNELKKYEKALEKFYAKDWETAIKLFEKLTHEYPDIYAYKLYLDRSDELNKKPPSKKWDGVYSIHMK